MMRTKQLTTVPELETVEEMEGIQKREFCEKKVYLLQGETLKILTLEEGGRAVLVIVCLRWMNE